MIITNIPRSYTNEKVYSQHSLFQKELSFISQIDIPSQHYSRIDLALHQAMQAKTQTPSFAMNIPGQLWVPSAL